MSSLDKVRGKVRGKESQAHAKESELPLLLLVVVGLIRAQKNSSHIRFILGLSAD